MAGPTMQEIEARKAEKRVNAYLSGGSGPVLLSRAFVAGFMIVIRLILSL